MKTDSGDGLEVVEVNVEVVVRVVKIVTVVKVVRTWCRIPPAESIAEACV